MPFSDVRIKDIRFTIRFSANQKHFESVNKKEHIVGLQLTGNALHTFNNHSFILKPNCIYFFNKDEDYVVDINDTGLSFSVHFTTFEPISLKSFCLPVKDNTKILNLLKKIEHNLNKENKTTAQTLSHLYELFSLFGEIYNGKYHPKDIILNEAREYINLHFKEHNCLDEAAKLYGVSRRRFCDIFSENFHITPHQYIVSRKIDIAKVLLSSGQFSVTDTAEYCGFSDVYYFSKVFKKETLCLPSKYIKIGGDGI